jgi:RNA recognition motif-containing protein
MQDQSFDKNYSMASTIEPYTSMYYPMHMYQMTEGHSYGLKSMPSILFPLGEFIIRPEGLGKDPRTTLMIKNIPNKYTIQYLSEEIDREFSNYYDFLYLPCDTKSGANQGYGFINFTDLEAIRRFYEMFHGKRWGRFRSEKVPFSLIKICNLTYARLQGIASLIEHFQNSKVLNHKEKKYQPIIKKILNQQISNLIKEQQIAHESTQLSRE